MGKDELLCGNAGTSPRKESHFQVKAGGGGGFATSGQQAVVITMSQ